MCHVKSLKALRPQISIKMLVQGYCVILKPVNKFCTEVQIASQIVPTPAVQVKPFHEIAAKFAVCQRRRKHYYDKEYLFASLLIYSIRK